MSSLINNRVILNSFILIFLNSSAKGWSPHNEIKELISYTFLNNAHVTDDKSVCSVLLVFNTLIGLTPILIG